MGAGLKEYCTHSEGSGVCFD